MLHACKAEEWAASEQDRMLTIMGSYQLAPIALINERGEERNALVQQERLPTLDEPCSVSAVPPPKKKQCTDSNSAVQIPSLYAIVTAGPYTATMLSNEYVEVDDVLAAVLNRDWWEMPVLRFVCSRLLAGMVLLNGTKGTAIVANTIEVYGRKRNVDSHHESYKSNRATRSSLPPTTTRYANVWPLTISDGDGKKLIIGTKSFNALVTSSLRVDAENSPDVGPTTAAFILDTDADSLATRIFIKKTAWVAAMALLNQPDAQQLANYDLLDQLRQLRTRFHHESTYLRCRASNEETDDLTCRPYTIFTLADLDSGSDDADYRLESLLLREIARAVLTRPTPTSMATLSKTAVRQLAQRLKSNSSDVGRIMGHVLALFGDNGDEIPIIGNSNLNNALQRGTFAWTKWYQKMRVARG
ncbi:hypothetical protein BC940DRAFT_318980 [Gongronella butleri]|nr:hypothetical protein BC940DRAFT_318980 [Gongronella butleri]